MDFRQARAKVREGSPVGEVAAQFVGSLTPEERLWCLDGDAPAWVGLGFLADNGYHKAPFHAAVIDRVGLPGIHFSDGPRGAVVGNATAFPVAMARGATWDPDLEERIGDAIGTELRAIGANLTGAVCVNLLRHPAWGRAQETYGEDPHHVGELGAAFTRGLQRHVMACAKHFAVNSMENARFTVDIEADEVALHELYLAQFKRIVDEGVASLMTSYNSLNGAWCGHNAVLLREILRVEWGFEGFTISDWIFGMRDAAQSVTGGLDVEMPYRMIRFAGLPDAIERGEVSWDQVDEAATHVVATLLRFDDVLSAPSPPRSVLGAPEHRALARETAARSVVLLRNEPVGGSPVLPLDTGQSVAVIGPLAGRVNLGDGGSSDVWDLECTTVLDGLQAAVGDAVHDDGSDPTRAAEVAAGADAAVVVVGYTYLDEGEYIGATDPELVKLFPPTDEPEVAERFRAEISDLPEVTAPQRMAERPNGFSVGGDRRSLELHDSDVELIRAVAAANPRTVVVIQAGSAVVMADWAGSVPAIAQAWYGGCQAGPGLADVLTGAVEPSGRLPFSIPVRESDLPDFDVDATSFTYDRWHGWWHLQRNGTRPAYPFGFGLSWTTFEITDSSVTVDSDRLTVGCTVADTGDRDGTDVVQVYAELPNLGIADEDRPARLVGFGRVAVPAGDTAEVSIEVPLDRLATRDPESHTWVAPSGPHTISVSRHVGDPGTRTHTVEL